MKNVIFLEFEKFFKFLILYEEKLENLDCTGIIKCVVTMRLKYVTLKSLFNLVNESEVYSRWLFWLYIIVFNPKKFYFMMKKF